MSISGNLKTMELAELLQWLSGAKKTGTLVLDGPGVEKKIYFRDGLIVSAASTNPNEMLGHFLVSQGYITEEELVAATLAQEEQGRLLGEILVEIGAVSTDELEALLRLKAEETIFDVFTWGEGDFRFHDGELPEHPLIPVSMDVTGIILEGGRRVDEWNRYRDRIPSPRCVVVAVADLFDDPDQTEGERRLLAMIDDDRTVEEIRLQSHSTDFFLYGVLFRQLAQGKVKVVKPRHDEAAASSPAATPVAAPKGEDGRIDAASLVRAGQHYLANGDYAQALRHLTAARSLEPESSKIRRAAEDGEAFLRTQLRQDGVAPNAVPTLRRPLNELSTLPLSPHEGFLLTRINGDYDVQSILKISPMPPLDAMLVLWRLARAGHISLEQKRP